MGQQQVVCFVERGDVRVAGEGDELRAGDLAAALSAASCISSASPAQMRHGTRHALRSCETRPSTWVDRHAASSAAGSFFSSVHVRSGSGKR